MVKNDGFMGPTVELGWSECDDYWRSTPEIRPKGGKTGISLKNRRVAG